jgi:hypothetical protein
MSSTPETIAAGTWREWFEPGDFFRLLSTTAPVSVEFYSNGKKTVELQSIEAGYAEYFRGEDGKLPFDRVRIYSVTTQTVQFVTRQGSDVRYDRGASSVTGTVALDAATLLALEETTQVPKLPGADWASFSAFVAGTAIQIFTPGANANGAIIWDAEASDLSTGAFSLIAKAGAAPTTIVDGEVLAVSVFGAGSSGSLSLRRPARIAPGKGLYLIAAGAGSAHAKTARYTLL